MRCDDRRHRLHPATTVDDAYTLSSLTRPLTSSGAIKYNDLARSSGRLRKRSLPGLTYAYLQAGVANRATNGRSVEWVTRRDGRDRVCIVSEWGPKRYVDDSGASIAND